MSQLVNALTAISYIYRGMGVLAASIKVGKKISEFDKETWEKKDYADVVLVTTQIVADTISLGSNIQGSLAEHKLAQLDKTSPGSNSLEKARLEREVASWKSTSDKAHAVATASYLFNKCNHARSIKELLKDPEVWARILSEAPEVLKKIQGQFPTSPSGSECLEGNPFPTDYQMLSDEYNNDPVLGAYLCQITQKPCRYPVQVDGKYYEWGVLKAKEAAKFFRSKDGNWDQYPIKVSLNALASIESRLTELGAFA